MKNKTFDQRFDEKFPVRPSLNYLDCPITILESITDGSNTPQYTTNRELIKSFLKEEIATALGRVVLEKFYDHYDSHDHLCKPRCYEATERKEAIKELEKIKAEVLKSYE